MKHRLHWKLMLATTVPAIAVTVGIIWLAFDQLAANYFMVLMDKYMVSPTDTHQAFLTAVHRYLLWASLVALLLTFLLSYLLTRRVLRPLSQMIDASRQIAAGDFTARVDANPKDEIGELGTAFNLMGDSLEQLELLRKTMVADVAHELRTPLTNLRGYLEGLSDGVIPPDKEILEMLQQENLRLVSLVEDLGQMARADAASVYLERQTVNLPECIGEILTLYRMNFEEKNISISTRLDEHLTVQADRDKLLQAIRNRSKIAGSTPRPAAAWSFPVSRLHMASAPTLSTVAPVFRSRTSPLSSSASSRSIPHVPARPAAPESGWRSARS